MERVAALQAKFQGTSEKLDYEVDGNESDRNYDDLDFIYDADLQNDEARNN